MTTLCATNFSPEAIAAATVAAELARQRSEELWLVFVMPSNTARAFGEKVFSAADETLKGEAARIQKLGARVTTALLIGKPHLELPRFAAENKISLVVAGDTRKEPSFLGTGVLARLAQHLDVPLWVVREPERTIAWARGERPLKVMIGMDRTHSTEVAVRWLEKLGTHGPLDVVGGHIYWPPVECQRLGLPLPRAWNDAHPELVRVLNRELVEKLPPALGQRVRIEPAMGRVSDHLTALAVEERVDLLVLGTHRHGALGVLWSVAEQCLQSAPVSVACVPSAGFDAEDLAAIPRVGRVLVATDLTPEGDRSVAWGLAILAPGGSAELVHVSPTALSAGQEHKLTDGLLARVPSQARLRGFGINAHVLVNPNPTQAIVAAAERFTSAVICVPPRLSKGLVEATHRPVLIVRLPQP